MPITLPPRSAAAPPDAARQDLALVVTAGPAGAKVSGFSIRYTAGGKRYAVDVDYDIVMCGTEVHDSSCTSGS